MLVLAPTGRDAVLIAGILLKEGIAWNVCSGSEQLAHGLEQGVGAILLAEEALAGVHEGLRALICRQPPWSDIPILVLTRQGADSPMVARAVETLGNVTLLERPVRVSALLSAVHSALRARTRQYQTRDHLRERDHANERKDQFLATLAHELRNPLAPIRNSLRVLRLSGASQSLASVSAIMERQVDLMVRLIDDLMDVARITRGTIELRKASVELSSVIATAVETSRPLIESGSHELELEWPGERVVLDADAVRLAQVFANLLNNAAKYTDPGGRISITVHLDSANVYVTIRDTGIGMSPETLPNIFDMFVQADASDRRAQTGLGIGLTLVRSLVEMHGGSVAAASAGKGFGSEFVVRLPLGSVGHVGPPLAPPAPNVAPALQRVLVVDDNQDAADTLGALLEMLGTDVRIVYDGPSALVAIDDFHPHVVVLDLGMPGMNGFEVASKIRMRRDAQASTLVALTGWGQDKDRQMTREAGFRHHLIKPVDIDDLQKVLATVAI